MAKTIGHQIRDLIRAFKAGKVNGGAFAKELKELNRKQAAGAAEAAGASPEWKTLMNQARPLEPSNTIRVPPWQYQQVRQYQPLSSESLSVPRPSPLPFETKFGEIEAWRAWLWDQAKGRLVSVWTLTPWEPGEVMQSGEIQMRSDIDIARNKMIMTSRLRKHCQPDQYGHFGIHGFKEDPGIYWMNYSVQDHSLPIVYGKVRLWGELIEHERGYRAEFARIIHLDRVEEPCFYKLSVAMVVNPEALSQADDSSLPQISAIRRLYGLPEGAST